MSSRKKVAAGAQSSGTVDKTAFAKAWQKAGSIAEVSEKTGLGNKDASQLASRLRKAGAKLKTFKTGGRIDIDAINAAIAE